MNDLGPRLAAHAAWVASAGAEGTRLIARDADLRGADLERTELTGADLAGARLSGANLIEAELAEAVLTGADLTGADLYRAFAPGARFDGADLTGGCLVKADVTHASLRRAVLRRADCVRADFYGSDLTGADFSRAQLLRASLMKADLSGTTFTEADAAVLAVDGSRFDVGAVGGLVGSIGPFDDTLTVVGDGPERQVTLAELLDLLTRRGATVTTWTPGERPADPPPWRWAPAQPD